MMTFWYFVMLFTAGDIFVLNPDYPPIKLKTQQECVNYAVSLMIDKRSGISINCIEADDDKDLYLILMRNFNFGQGLGENS